MSSLARYDGPTGLNYSREWGHNAQVQRPVSHRVTVSLVVARDSMTAEEVVHIHLPRRYENVMSATLVGAYSYQDFGPTIRSIRLTGVGRHPLFPSRQTGFETSVAGQPHTTSHSIFVPVNPFGFQMRQLLGTWKDSNGVLPQEVLISQTRLDGSPFESGAHLVLDIELELARWA